jgi:hypothetical protein
VLAAALALSFGARVGAVRTLELAPGIAPIEIRKRYGLFISSDNPALPYTLKPGARDISSYGIRDREYTLDKPPGTRRIVVLGDSVGFGLCQGRGKAIARDLLFSERVEHDLNVAGHPVEVINLAISGYNTVQEVALFEEKGLALSPDLVLVAYVLNDHLERPSIEAIRITRRDGAFSEYQALSSAVLKELILRSHLARVVWYWTGQRSDDEQQHTNPALEPYREQVAGNFARLTELSRSHDFEVLVVLFPNLDRQKGGDYEDEWQHILVTDIARRAGFEALDLLPGFLAASGGDLKKLRGRCGEMHPDEHGHGVAAELIRDYVLETRFGERAAGYYVTGSERW